MTAADNGTMLNLLPARKFSLPVDARQVLANGTAHAGENIPSELNFEIDPAKRYILKNDLTMLAVIAANHWKRPICFTSTTDISALGLGKYLRCHGMSYELTPIADNPVDNDVAYKTVMQKFQYGHAGTPGVYFDEENRRRLNAIKVAHVQIAQSLIEAGRKADARRILEHYDNNVDAGNFPYGETTNLGNMDNRYSLFFLEDCYAADDDPLAAKVAASMTKDLQQQMQYYQSLGESMTDEQLAINAQQAMQGKPNNLSDRQQTFAADIVTSYQFLLQIKQLAAQAKAARNPAGPPM
jgi:hypothetical protein